MLARWGCVCFQPRASPAEPRGQAELWDLVWGEDVVVQIVREAGLARDKDIFLTLSQVTTDLLGNALDALSNLPKDPHCFHETQFESTQIQSFLPLIKENKTHYLGISGEQSLKQNNKLVRSFSFYKWRNVKYFPLTCGRSVSDTEGGPECV